jgi:hypothetical protein
MSLFDVQVRVNRIEVAEQVRRASLHDDPSSGCGCGLPTGCSAVLKARKIEVNVL